MKSTFNVAGQGSNLFAGASFFPEASLVLTKNAFDCRGNALQGQTLEELVADTKEGDWATQYQRVTDRRTDRRPDYINNVRSMTEAR